MHSLIREQSKTNNKQYYNNNVSKAQMKCYFGCEIYKAVKREITVLVYMTLLSDILIYK